MVRAWSVQGVSMTRTEERKQTYCHTRDHCPFTSQVTWDGVRRSEEGKGQCHCHCTKDGPRYCEGLILLPSGRTVIGTVVCWESIAATRASQVTETA
ncbi:Lactose permease [Fusarium oxysporum f. sp. albedinis]|nr:Lactose permease [Fusarium oxysporum f. sp. albedinis]